MTGPDSTKMAEFAHLIFLAFYDERWKEVPGFPGCQASTHGRVRGLKGQIMKGGLTGGKRRYLLGHNLTRNGKKCTRAAHRIILETFIGPRSEGMECRHLDGNGQNNHLWNLKWGTRQENMDDMERHGTKVDAKGEANNKAKLTEANIKEMRRLAAEGRSVTSLAKQFGVGQPHALRIVRRMAWTHI